MGQPRDIQYCKAYIQGYRDGVRDVQSGKDLTNVHSDLTQLPIEAMALSTRAYNCLTRANCHSIGNVLSLDSGRI